ncbi:hypothetical protein [Streptomyces angustmyceticus]|uniref:hypothetical protein n=1 Tax=Streptomyces angustmyceticus TaxID=285578 RepID=UPI0034500138
MSEEQFEEGSAVIGRAQSLRPSVPLYRHMIYGSGLSHSLDFVVLMHIHFMCEDGKDFTVQDLIDSLRAEGIRNANGKGDGLVGSKAVYESVARLRAAGFLHRAQGNGGSFGKVSYTFHEFPATDPNWTPPGMSGSTGDLPFPLTGEAQPTSNEISAGQTASPHKGSADKGSADRRSGKSPILAGQTGSPLRGSGKGSPPHPPEGGGNSSPQPPKTGNKGRAPKADRLAVACALTDEDYQPTKEQIAAADTWLQDLRGKWQQSIPEARTIAPLLASYVHALDHELDDYLELLLTQEDPKDKVIVASRVLPHRIKHLKRRRRDEREPLPQQQGASSGGGIGWCGECNGGEMPLMPYQRTVELPDGTDVPCEACHPKYARSNA